MELRKTIYYELEKSFTFQKNKPKILPRRLILFRKAILIAFASAAITFSLMAEPSIESRSRINWITREFISDISMDVKKAKVQMPSGKKTASAKIKSKMPQLIQPPLLQLYADSSSRLADYLITDKISFDQINTFIMSGYKTPDIFATNLSTLNTTNTINVKDLGPYLVKHTTEYTPEEPIDIVYSRPYSGIIIDARGAYKIHGEYTTSSIYPCLFPTIWDEEMNPVLEKDMVNPEIVKQRGMTGFHYSDNLSDYENITGGDPLYIRVTEVYGNNRTDPVIKRKDALKILAVPENVKLLQEGKVVLLMDKENLIYDIAAPEKDETYYVNFESIKQYFYENKVPVQIIDSIDGILFRVHLNFYPDSEKLLPGETDRIAAIAESLKTLLTDDGYTIMVEGHTADVGKPEGQLNLSIERTQTVMNALIAEDLDESLFTYRGYGGTMPIATNATEEGRAQNRRVDITARPRATYIQRDW